MDIAVSSAERSAGVLSPANLRLATTLLHAKGCVPLRRATPPPVAADDGFADIYAERLASRDNETLHMVGVACRVARRTRAR